MLNRHSCSTRTRVPFFSDLDLEVQNSDLPAGDSTITLSIGVALCFIARLFV
jgi:hypothetical protein